LLELVCGVQCFIVVVVVVVVVVVARAALWCSMLGLEIDDIDLMYYDSLKHCVLQHHLLVDSLIYKDVKLTATNDDQYFVFEDYLYQVQPPFYTPHTHPTPSLLVYKHDKLTTTIRAWMV